ncbi:MAG: 30S ribosomal protein S13 [Nitrososphaerota archaeon]|nr:30S ribosomal protein S13 [Nitrososphaerota archaeon]MDG7046280.1 30S ribosomal protein S13 [Nitrososphaerota archaeon]MDG7047973.1 30S ribosomal protein S13 [Nitrososphaerota archaeon]
MSSQVRGIIRVAGRDLNGYQPLVAALSKLRGINYNLAMAILNNIKIDPNIRLGKLSDQQLQLIEKALKNAQSLGLPNWMLNRRKDLESGIDKHLLESELELQVKQDIEREKGLNSWRGLRHAYGLKVRGQRTRTTGRKGLTVGVRKTVLVAAAAAARQGAEGAAPQGQQAPAAASSPQQGKPAPSAQARTEEKKV